METKPLSKPRVFLARMVLAAFVVGGLFYFSQGFPLEVDLALRFPCRVASPGGTTAVLRRDVRQVDVVLHDEDGEAVQALQLYLSRGGGPDNTPSSRVSLVPGEYIAFLTLTTVDERSVSIQRSLQVEEAGELVLDLR
jgi:hypothetical protein